MLAPAVRNNLGNSLFRQSPTTNTSHFSALATDRALQSLTIYHFPILTAHFHFSYLPSSLIGAAVSSRRCTCTFPLQVHIVLPLSRSLFPTFRAYHALNLRLPSTIHTSALASGVLPAYVAFGGPSSASSPSLPKGFCAFCPRPRSSFFLSPANHSLLSELWQTKDTAGFSTDW